MKIIVILSTSNGFIIQTFTNYLKPFFLFEHVVEWTYTLVLK